MYLINESMQELSGWLKILQSIRFGSEGEATNALMLLTRIVASPLNPLTLVVETHKSGKTYASVREPTCYKPGTGFEHVHLL